MDWFIRETVDIDLHLNNLNRENRFSLGTSCKPLIHFLKERKEKVLS
jgi:hypothetical protein